LFAFLYLDTSVTRSPSRKETIEIAKVKCDSLFRQIFGNSSVNLVTRVSAPANLVERVKVLIKTSYSTIWPSQTFYR